MSADAAKVGASPIPLYKKEEKEEEEEEAWDLHLLFLLHSAMMYVPRKNRKWKSPTHSTQPKPER